MTAVRNEYVICLSSSGAMLWSWKGRAGFAPVRAGGAMDSAQLVAALRALPAAPVAVLVDRVDEEHVRDSLPQVGRRDQQALLGRKLARAFPRSMFRTAALQGPSLRSPGEIDVLLSALTRPEPVRELLDTLAAARIPVTGVHVPALLAGRLLDDAARSADATLLVLRRAGGRLQHCFFRRGRLAGSRGLRAASGAHLGDGLLLQRQIEESLRYFDATWRGSAEQPLQLLLPAADLEALVAAGAVGEHWQPRALAPAEISRRLRLPVAFDPDKSVRSFIDMLRVPPTGDNFAAARERRYFQLFRARRIAATACLGLTGLALAGALGNGLAILAAGQQAAGSAAAADQLEAALPDPGSARAEMDPLRMRAVVMAYDAVAAHQVDPAWILAAVGEAVTASPRIRLDGIEWSVGPPAAAQDATPGDPAADSLTDPASAPAALPADDSIRVRLRGHVAPFSGDYVQAFAEVEAFADELRAHPAAAQVTFKSQPLDINPGATLTDEVSGEHAGQAKAGFALELLMRLPDATG